MTHLVADLFVWAREGDELHRKEVAPLKKALAKMDLKLKEQELQLKMTEDAMNPAMQRAKYAERLLTDPVLLAEHVCKGLLTVEASSMPSRGHRSART